MSYRSYRGDNIAPILAIIILCFLVYIATILPRFLDFLNYNLVELFGLQPATFIHMPWTIVTNLFVHDPSSPWHLIFNMLTLYFFGTFLIRLVRTRTFLVIYFLGGIVGNIFVWLLQMHSYIPVIGASGAIFALGGTLAVLTPRLRVYAFPIPVPMPLWVAVIGGFIILALASGFLSISWQGHLGGLVTGLLAGLILRRGVRTPLS
ncbi:MAG: rhomboid family intramembrane serine protease [Chloroflexi bacterium]|nr:rhomboid family intramembrane serine protease [Chloroflexota bacterium]